MGYRGRGDRAGLGNAGYRADLRVRGRKGTRHYVESGRDAGQCDDRRNGMVGSGSVTVTACPQH